ncbi:hypothetical protein ASG56_20440 [Rhodococcus sp. Leaf7]|nr:MULTISPECIES: hypothetical protein [unclassified Rhodococcus (in: high G+C Gram-positive bacteria)]KQU03152.1 hypothetical protein ASG56_20440 [Rhodococcus sp. Leaf7]KQU38952.1 hypothetical protein ASG64_17925 [Rhodococcus sp. Leaf247]
MRRRTTMLALTAVSMIVGGGLVATAPAGAAEPAWNGRYSLERSAASKTGTSLAARQGEPDFSDTYTFTSMCLGGTCSAVVTGGPAPKNATLPQPPVYTWNGTSWVHVYDWQWDCYMGEGVEKVYAPAHSEAYYTPQPDGTFTGAWTTTITGGPCNGDVTMNVAAYPVGPAAAPFGS